MNAQPDAEGEAAGDTAGVTAGDTAGETAGLIDSHAHLHDRAFGTDRAAVLARARAAGLSAIVTVGTDRPESEAAVALARAEPDVFAAVGFHPHDAKDWTAAERRTSRRWRARRRSSRSARSASTSIATCRRAPTRSGPSAISCRWPTSWRCRW